MKQTGNDDGKVGKELFEALKSNTSLTELYPCSKLWSILK